MLTPPALAAMTITGCLHDRYGLRLSQATFLPTEADTNSAVYRRGTTYAASTSSALNQASDQ